MNTLIIQEYTDRYMHFPSNTVRHWCNHEDVSEVLNRLWIDGGKYYTFIINEPEQAGYTKHITDVVWKFDDWQESAD